MSKSQSKILFNKIIAKRKTQGLLFNDFLYCIATIASNEKWIGKIPSEKINNVIYHIEVVIIMNQKGNGEKIRINPWINDSSNYIKQESNSLNSLLCDNPYMVLPCGIKRNIDNNTATINEDSCNNLIDLSDNLVLFSKKTEKDSTDLTKSIRNEKKEFNLNIYDDLNFLVTNLNIQPKTPLGKLFKKYEEFIKKEYPKLMKKKLPQQKTELKVKSPKKEISNKNNKNIIDNNKNKNIIDNDNNNNDNNEDDLDSTQDIKDKKLLHKVGIDDPMSDRASIIVDIMNKQPIQDYDNEISTPDSETASRSEPLYPYNNKYDTLSSPPKKNKKLPPNPPPGVDFPQVIDSPNNISHSPLINESPKLIDDNNLPQNINDTPQNNNVNNTNENSNDKNTNENNNDNNDNNNVNENNNSPPPNNEEEPNQNEIINSPPPNNENDNTNETINSPPEEPNQNEIKPPEDINNPPNNENNENISTDPPPTQNDKPKPQISHSKKTPQRGMGRFRGRPKPPNK